MKKANPVMVLSLIFVCGCRKQEAAKQEPVKQEPTQQQTAQPKVEQPAVVTPESPKWDRKGNFVTAFGATALAPMRRDSHVSYSFDPNVERFFVHVPEDYTGETPYGLIVFTDADSDSRQLPEGWQAVLDHASSSTLLHRTPEMTNTVIAGWDWLSSVRWR